MGRPPPKPQPLRAPQRPGPGDSGISPLHTRSSPASAWERLRPRFPHLSREQVPWAPASPVHVLILASSPFEVPEPSSPWATTGAVMVTACKVSVPGRAAHARGADASAAPGRRLHAGAPGSASATRDTLTAAGEGTGHTALPAGGAHQVPEAPAEGSRQADGRLRRERRRGMGGDPRDEQQEPAGRGGGKGRPQRAGGRWGGSGGASGFISV